MTNLKWVIGLALMFGILTVISQIVEAQYYSSDIVTFKTAFDHITAVSTKDWWGSIWEVFKGFGDFLRAIVNIFLWDYSFFTGDFAIIRWVLFVPMSVITFFSLILEIGQSV